MGSYCPTFSFPYLPGDDAGTTAFYSVSFQLRAEMSSLQRLHLSEAGFSLFFLGWFYSFLTDYELIVLVPLKAKIVPVLRV